MYIYPVVENESHDVRASTVAEEDDNCGRTFIPQGKLRTHYVKPK